MGGTEQPTTYYFAEWFAIVNKNRERNREPRLTQTKIADEASITRGYVSALWSGKHDKKPTSGTVAAIARGMGLHPMLMQLDPSTFEAKALAAVMRLSKGQQETALNVLESLAARHSTRRP